MMPRTFEEEFPEAGAILASIYKEGKTFFRRGAWHYFPYLFQITTDGRCLDIQHAQR